MEKYCKSCGRVFDDLNFKICPYCGGELATRYGRQPIPRKLRHEVFKRDGYRCRECGASKDETSLEIDHIVPVARGGTNDIDNLQTLCRECNRMKHTDTWVGGETDLEVAQNELDLLEEQLDFARKNLKQAIDEDEIIDFKFKIKKLELEEIPKVKVKLNKLIHKEEASNTKMQKLDEEKQMFDRIIKEVYVELDQNILLRLHNRICSFLSIDAQSLEQSLLCLLKEHSNNTDFEPDPNNSFSRFIKRDKKYYKDYIYSFIYEFHFEKMNTTTNSIFDLGNLKVLIILKDGTNLTNWNDVENKQDILYITEDLSGKKDLSRKYQGLTNLQAIELCNMSHDVTSMEYMFEGCTSLKGISSFANLDVSRVKDMESMFEDCKELFDLSSLKNWNVCNVKNISYMFKNCRSLKKLSSLKNWELFNVDDMSYIFSGCCGLTDLNGLEEWNVSQGYYMEGMFKNCTFLSDISSLKDWDVSHVRKMSHMFSECKSLCDLSSLKDWDVSNVKYMDYMFYSCYDLSDSPSIDAIYDGLESLNGLNNWNVSNVKKMNYMFYECSNLTDISALSNWNVSHVKNMNHMFSYCEYLIDISALSNWNVFNVEDTSNMFKECWKLRDVSALKNWKPYNLIKMDNMFEGWSAHNLLEWYELSK